MATSVYFDARNNRNWTSAQKDAVNRIQSISRCKFQSELDIKVSECNDEWDSYSQKKLEEVKSVLLWFINSGYYKQNWINNVIERLLTSIKNRILRAETKTSKPQAQVTSKKKNSPAEVKVEAPKTPTPKKTADVSTAFPSFEEASFPDTSKDLFEEMLSKGSKMPNV